MNGNSLFLDTNILIYLLKGNQEVRGLLHGRDFVISFITELELLSFPSSSPEEKTKIEDLLKECFVVDINNKIKEVAIAIRMKNKLKLPDAIVCATSIFLELPLLTADKQLSSVKEADIILYEL